MRRARCAERTRRGDLTQTHSARAERRTRRSCWNCARCVRRCERTDRYVHHAMQCAIGIPTSQIHTPHNDSAADTRSIHTTEHTRTEQRAKQKPHSHTQTPSRRRRRRISRIGRGCLHTFREIMPQHGNTSALHITNAHAGSQHTDSNTLAASICVVCPQTNYGKLGSRWFWCLIRRAECAHIELGTLTHATHRCCSIGRQTPPCNITSVTC